MCPSGKKKSEWNKVNCRVCKVKGCSLFLTSRNIPSHWHLNIDVPDTQAMPEMEMQVVAAKTASTRAIPEGKTELSGSEYLKEGQWGS